METLHWLDENSWACAIFIGTEHKEVYMPLLTSRRDSDRADVDLDRQLLLRADNAQERQV